MQQVIVTAKFKVKDGSGFVFYVLLVEQGRSPKPDSPKPAQVSAVVQSIRQDMQRSTPTYRVYYGSDGVKAQVAAFRTRLGQEAEVRNFDFSDFYPDGTSAARPFVRVVSSAASSSSRTA